MTGGGGSFATATSTTDAAGIATVSFTTSSVSGTVHTVTATSGTFTGSSPFITTLNGAAVKYVVSVSNTAVSAGTAVRISAQLVDGNGNAVPTAGKTVNWTTNGANGFFSSATSTTSGSGFATVVLSTSLDGGVDYVVTATDSDGLTGSGADIHVGAASIPPGAAPLITSALTANTAAGADFTYQITALGDQPMTFTASPLPPGLILSGDTLTGAVVVAGTYVTHLTATNAAGSDSIDLVIVASPSQDLSLEKGQVKLNFSKENADALSAVFNLTLPDGATAQNAVVTVQFGNATFANMTIAAAKTRSSSNGATIGIKPAVKGSSSLLVTLFVKNSNLKDALAHNGLINDDINQATPLKLPIVVVLKSDAGTFYCSGLAALTYKAKKNKTGSAKK
jgi:adhesin/invasin